MSDQFLPQKAAVVGLGTMGAGIAYVLASHGIAIVGVDVSEDAVQRARATMERLCDRAVKRGTLTEEAASQTRERITLETTVDSIAGCDLFIEAVPEDADLKAGVLGEIDAVANSSTVIATNTSTLSITALSQFVSRPERFLGVHFFHPVEAMALVEVVQGPNTDPDVVRDVASLMHTIGKEVVHVDDRPGFIVNSVLISYLNQAIDELDGRLADAETIDTAVRLGLGYKIGPYELLDLIGLDTQLTIAEKAYEQTRRPEHAPPPLLRRLVQAGRLGNKTNYGIRIGQEQPS